MYITVFMQGLLEFIWMEGYSGGSSNAGLVWLFQYCDIQGVKAIPGKRFKLIFIISFLLVLKKTFFSPNPPMFFCLQKADYQSFLLRYLLFLYQQWFFQNIEKGWRKIFEIRLFPQFLKMTKIIKIYFLQPFSIF